MNKVDLDDRELALIFDSLVDYIGDPSDLPQDGDAHSEFSFQMDTLEKIKKLYEEAYPKIDPEIVPF
jgi:hypothetical protein